MVTYGTLRWEPGWFVIDAVPYVSMRIKRLFPRVRAVPGAIRISDTPEVARDLEWLLQRHPLTVDDDTYMALSSRSQRHRDLEQTRARIIAGDLTLDHLVAPAREPRTYQVQAADLCLATGRLLLADDVGLGKTFSSLLLLRDPNALPALVVTLTHLPRQWERELFLSMPWLSCHVAKKGSAYDVSADVIILNYAKLAGWADHLAGQVKTVIFDEVQELRHDGSAKYIGAQKVAGAADRCMGLSATPVYNYGGEVHNIFQVLAPDALGTRQEFVREWGAEFGGGHVKVKDPGALGTYLRDEGLMLRRTRKDVHREIPEPLKIVHEVEADSAALDAVKGDVRALAELIRTSSDKQERWTARGQIDWKLRQATGIDKSPYVAEFVRMLLESERKVVLFGWHRAVYDIWMQQLDWARPVLYTGSESPTQKQAAADEFINGISRVLIMSLRSGAGLDGLQKVASCAVFGELDWSPAMHDQCIGRLARDGQEDTVAAYFLVSDHGADPAIAEVLELKRQQAEPIRDPNMPLFQQAPAEVDRVQMLVDSILGERP